MTLDTLIFDPAPCNFPKPNLPHLPVLPGGVEMKLHALPAWADARHFRHFLRGRFALREAYWLAGVGPGSTMLAPAYHCFTMLDPALALSGDVALYPLHEDLSPDLTALDRLANASATPIKAILATHFFGIPQDFAALAAWCSKRDITLVEDCSHALFTMNFRAPGCGRLGDFVISSPYKFFPSPDGGVLYARNARALTGIECRQPSLSAELRGIAEALSVARHFHRASRACDVERLTSDIAAIDAAVLPGGHTMRSSHRYSPYYRPAKERLASLRFSRFVERHANLSTISARRRTNYHRWLAGVRGLTHCKPLYPQLPEGCVPYMFPLYFDNPDRHFHVLMRLGVPIWRWDSIAVSDCPTANDYRLKLLHLPCHQSLTNRDLDWMIEAVRKVGAGETAPAR